MAGATATESREILISNLLKLFPRKRHDRGHDGPLGIPLPSRHTSEQTIDRRAAGCWQNAYKKSPRRKPVFREFRRPRWESVLKNLQNARPYEPSQAEALKDRGNSLRSLPTMRTIFDSYFPASCMPPPPPPRDAIRNCEARRTSSGRLTTDSD